jgi:hypothetical protein
MTATTPSIDVLIRSVVEWIDDIRPTLTAPHDFLSRVASGALGVVGRELALGPAAAAAEWARLAALLGHDGDRDELRDELSDSIQAGHMTVRTPDLLDALFATTVDQLAIDQPGYRFEVDGQVRSAAATAREVR